MEVKKKKAHHFQAEKVFIIYLSKGKCSGRVFCQSDMEDALWVLVVHYSFVEWERANYLSSKYLFAPSLMLTLGLQTQSLFSEADKDEGRKEEEAEMKWALCLQLVLFLPTSCTKWGRKGDDSVPTRDCEPRHKTLHIHTEFSWHDPHTNWPPS